MSTHAQVPGMENRPEQRRAAFPFLDLKAQFAGIRGEIQAAVNKVLESQNFILGPEVRDFEAEVAKFVGSEFAVGCASGSDALLLALMSLGIEPGDEVITTPFTFGATAGSIARLQAKPVFVDIDPFSYNIAPGLIPAAITAKTRAIMPVHLFGLMADMDAIVKTANAAHVAIVEDAAQAIGAGWNGHAAGTLGAVGCFSFFPSKNLGGAGDGGLVTTNDAALTDHLRILRVHGSRNKYSYESVGMNSRLDALQAAILRVKLRYLPAWTAARQRNANRYRAMFIENGLETYIQFPADNVHQNHVYNQFVIRLPDRDAVRRHLQQAGIPTEIYYPFPLHLEPAFAHLGYSKGDFPQAEAACREVLALPIFAELTEDQQASVVAAIADFYGHKITC
jgi:dTDP-4-amino-4,6-dideoxygalactose transaminase